LHRIDIPESVRIAAIARRENYHIYDALEARKTALIVIDLCRDGFVYVAFVIDAYAIGRSIDARLALAALKVAIERRHPRPGCIHHSDRGSRTRLVSIRGCWRTMI